MVLRQSTGVVDAIRFVTSQSLGYDVDGVIERIDFLTMIKMGTGPMKPFDIT
jgi:hypothetical protein